MVRDTPPSKDVSTHQIWNSYLKEYRRYGPDTKAGRTDGLTDGRTVRLLYAFQSSFGGIKNLIVFLEELFVKGKFSKNKQMTKSKQNPAPIIQRTKQVLLQIVKTQMKRPIMWHFISTCTICFNKMVLQRKKYNIF